jgi:adenylate kinase
VGLQAKAVMERGELVSDEIVSALIGEELDAMGADTGAIFDGYPRTEAQAGSLETILSQRGRTLDHVIELEVNEDALVDRIIGRFTCASCGKGYHDTFEQPKQADTCDKCGSHEFKRRPDDNEETVRTRMAEYRAKTAPILPIYEARGIVARVDGMAEMDVVTEAIDNVLKG